MKLFDDGNGYAWIIVAILVALLLYLLYDIVVLSPMGGS